MFEWIKRTTQASRIRELEEKLKDNTHDYARLMRNCDEHIHEINIKDHEINTLYGKLATNHQEIGGAGRGDSQVGYYRQRTGCRV